MPKRPVISGKIKIFAEKHHHPRIMIDEPSNNHNDLLLVSLWKSRTV
jgi:hypothetical protein